MSNDGKNKKITGIAGTDATKNIQRTENISEVEQVKKAGAVTGTSAITGGVRRSGTRVMSKQELEEFFKLVDQEAEKMFANSGFSKEHQEVVQQAVKMAVNASTIIEDDSEDDKK